MSGFRPLSVSTQPRRASTFMVSPAQLVLRAFEKHSHSPVPDLSSISTSGQPLGRVCFDWGPEPSTQQDSDILWLGRQCMQCPRSRTPPRVASLWPCRRSSTRHAPLAPPRSVVQRLPALVSSTLCLRPCSAHASPPCLLMGLARSAPSQQAVLLGPLASPAAEWTL